MSPPPIVVRHNAFSAHGNRVGTQGARLVNLPLTGSAESFARVRDPEVVVRLAARDPVASAQALQAELQPLPPALLDCLTCWRVT